MFLKWAWSPERKSTILLASTKWAAIACSDVSKVVFSLEMRAILTVATGPHPDTAFVVDQIIARFQLAGGRV
jgi:hypothetical protein